MRFVVYLTCMLSIILLLLIVIDSDTKDMTLVCFNDMTCFTVFVADTFALRQQGLMGVTHLDSNEGMLFIFEKEASQTFWMKDTLIPLDIIWISKDLRVVGVTTAVPCEVTLCERYPSVSPVQYVLEVPAGSFENYGLSKGDRVTID